MLCCCRSRLHTKPLDQQPTVDLPVKFSCLSCGFSESCTETDYFSHLHNAHLKVNHKVSCPYKDCDFESSVYSTFKAHKSKAHKEHSWKRFKSEIIGCDYEGHDRDDAQEQISHADDLAELEEVSEEASENDIHVLGKQNLASLC